MGSEMVLNAGDSIQCRDVKEALRIKKALKNEDNTESKIEYKRNGEVGVWLIITRTAKKGETDD